jgi:hypothetical protein
MDSSHASLSHHYRQKLVALDDYENSPAYLKRSDRRWAQEARSMLRSL